MLRICPQCRSTNVTVFSTTTALCGRCHATFHPRLSKPPFAFEKQAPAPTTSRSLITVHINDEEEDGNVILREAHRLEDLRRRLKEAGCSATLTDYSGAVDWDIGYYTLLLHVPPDEEEAAGNTLRDWGIPAEDTLGRFITLAKVQAPEGHRAVSWAVQHVGGDVLKHQEAALRNAEIPVISVAQRGAVDRGDSYYEDWVPVVYRFLWVPKTHWDAAVNCIRAAGIVRIRHGIEPPDFHPPLRDPEHIPEPMILCVEDLYWSKKSTHSMYKFRFSLAAARSPTFQKRIFVLNDGQRLSIRHGEVRGEPQEERSDLGVYDEYGTQIGCVPNDLAPGIEVLMRQVGGCFAWVEEKTVGEDGLRNVRVAVEIPSEIIRGSAVCPSCHQIVLEREIGPYCDKCGEGAVCRQCADMAGQYHECDFYYLTQEELEESDDM